MMRKDRIAIAAAVLLAAGTMFGGCGSSKSYAAQEAPMYKEETAGTYAYEEAYAEEVAEDAYYDEDMETVTGEGGVNGTADRTGAQMEQKLVYRGNVSLQTIAYADTMTGIRDRIGQYGGFTENESESNNNYNWYDYDLTEEASAKENTYQNRYANMTVRIPSENFQAFLGSLESCGQIMNKSTSTENISRTYYDTTASIEALETEEKRLLEMMDKAVNVEEMIAVESRLTDVETELNQARTHLSGMDADVNYSTVCIDITEVHKYTPIEPEPETFGDRIVSAFVGAWEFFGEFCQGLVLALIWLLPLVIVGGLLAVMIILILRKTKSKRMQKKQLKAQKKAAKYAAKNANAAEKQQSSENM